MIKRRDFVAGSVSLGALTMAPPLAFAQERAANSISLEDFFRHDRYRAISISPNGQHLAAIAPIGGRMNVAILDLKAMSARGITALTERDVRSVRWINNDRLSFDLIDLQSGLGEQRPSGLFALNRDGSEPRELMPANVATTGSVRFVYRYTAVLASVPDSDDVIAVNNERSAESFDVVRLNTKTARKTLLTFDNPGKTIGWLLDSNRVPRIAVTRIDRSTRTALFHRSGAGAAWDKIAEFDFLTNEGFDPIAFGPDDTLYVVAYAGGDKSAIYTYDLQARKLGERLIAHKDFDFGNGNTPPTEVVSDFFARNRHLIFDPKSKRLIGVRLHAEREELYWLDDEWAKVQAMVDGALKSRVNRISRAGETQNMLVYSYSDTEPGRWYLLDTEKRALQELVARRPWIRSELMSEQKPLRYKARDGLSIPAYLTLPRGREAKQLPLILLVHGGPFVRGETWAWQPDTQFFASRGYAVLQIDFRGSRGYGWQHYRAGWAQWGGAMQDDLTDGVEHLIAQGIADRTRVAIMGGSYGGYATLMGLVKTPDLYRCGVNVVGVSDLELLGNATWSDMDVESVEFQKWFALHVGDTKEKLQAASPALRADRVQRPILFAHGYGDVRVPIAHAERMRSALVRAGFKKELQWVVYEDEGHGFLREKNRFDFYDRVEKFLARHMG